MSKASGNWGVEFWREVASGGATGVGVRREVAGVELEGPGGPRGVRRREDGVEGRDLGGATEEAEPSE